jgi:hypothetical protein
VESQELAEYYQQFANFAQDAKGLTKGLSETQFNWRPAPEEWSIEECLAHLIIVGHWEVKAIEQAIDTARARGITGSGPFRYGTIDRFVIDLTRPPVKRRFPAPRRFQPLHGQPVTAVVPTFTHLQSQFQILTERADGLDLARVKVATPISSLLRMSLGGMFAQIAAHERRHMDQARRVLDRLAGQPTTPGVSR